MKIPLLSLSAASLLLTSAHVFAQASAADLIVSDDFESTAVGQIPKGFTKTGAIAVADDVAHSGKHSLKIEPAVKGGRFISLPPEKVAALGSEHWGRFYYKMKTPTPLPVIRTSVDHGTAFDIAGTGKVDERSMLEALRQASQLAAA